MFKNLTPQPVGNDPSARIVWMSENKHLCAKPFHTIQLRAALSGSGMSVGPCCNYTTVVKDIDENIFSDLRDNIQNGIVDPRCKLCHNKEATNIYSERVRDMAYWSNEMVDNFLSTSKSNNFNLGILFSNFCNLACRSCNEYSSSLYAKIKNIPVRTEISRDISEDSQIWESILEYTKTLSEKNDNLCIGLIGGETMIQKGAKKYLEYISNLPTSNNISVSFTSNFTVLDEEILSYSSKFRKISVTASIDSVGDNYHYVRWPASFSKVYDNIKRFEELRRNNPVYDPLTIATVFSLNNIFYINEYLDFLTDLNEQGIEFLSHILLLMNKPHFDVESLPIQYRPALLQIVETALENPILGLDNVNPLLVYLTNLKSFLSSDTKPTISFDKFLLETAKFDLETNCKFETLNKKFYDILSLEDKAIYTNALLKYA